MPIFFSFFFFSVFLFLFLFPFFFILNRGLLRKTEFWIQSTQIPNLHQEKLTFRDIECLQTLVKQFIFVSMTSFKNQTARFHQKYFHARAVEIKVLKFIERQGKLLWKMSTHGNNLQKASPLALQEVSETINLPWSSSLCMHRIFFLFLFQEHLQTFQQKAVLPWKMRAKERSRLWYRKFFIVSIILM